MYTVAVVILTLVIAWLVLYGLYRLSIYLMALHDREMEGSGLPRYRIEGFRRDSELPARSGDRVRAPASHSHSARPTSAESSL